VGLTENNLSALPGADGRVPPNPQILAVARRSRNLASSDPINARFDVADYGNLMNGLNAGDERGFLRLGKLARTGPAPLQAEDER